MTAQETDQTSPDHNRRSPAPRPRTEGTPSPRAEVAREEPGSAAGSVPAMGETRRRLGGKVPLVGVSQRTELRANRSDAAVFAQRELVRALRAAGADVVVLTHTDQRGIGRYVGMCDGILLPGGFDVDPTYFGEPILTHPEWVFPEADAFDIALARQAIATRTPLMGICRGAQVINVAMGGDMWQDIVTQLHGGRLGDGDVRHVADMESFASVRHEVRVRAGSLLAHVLELDGETDADGMLTRPVLANSSHHQAMRRIAPGFTPSAYAPDGIVEAIEATDPDIPVLGLQWHPERLWEAEPLHHLPFAWLVAQAARRMGD